MPKYRVLYMWREYINDCTHIGAKNKAIDRICKDLNIEPTEFIRQYFTAAMRVEDPLSILSKESRTEESVCL